MGNCFSCCNGVADPEANGSYPLTNTSESSAANSENRAKPQQKKMGNLLSVEQQRLDTASKTGVFALQDQNNLSFPMDTLKITGLRMLHIENCGLGAVPPDISKLAPSLKKLKLPRNKLSTLPDPASELAALELLDLSHNAIAQLPAALFASMARLKEANLSHNRLAALPASISACAQLKLLDLSHNALAALPGEVGLLAALEDLDISHNRLTEIAEGFGPGLKRLKRLTATHNQLCGLPAGLLTSSPVEVIRIEGNPLEKLPGAGGGVGLEGLPGFKEFRERNQRHVARDVDQRLRTGDLSQGLGTADEYAANRRF